MKKIGFFFLLITVNTFTANSQPNFKPGYIVLANGDTVHGEIDYRNWTYNPEKLTIMQNSVQKDYTVNDLLGFAISGADIYQ